MKRIIQIVGPTASGKTGLAIEIAKRCGGEIINVDSMQVYRDISVGTDKPTEKQQREADFSCIDLIPLGPPLDAAAFAHYADERIDYLTGVHRIPILCGGTGLYHKVIRFGLIEAPSRDDALRARLREERESLGQAALYARLQETDPVAASRIHPNDWVRIERALEVYEKTGQQMSGVQQSHGFMQNRYECLSFGCWCPRTELYDKIDRRLGEMWEGGIIEETQKMLDLNLDPEQLPLKALGYRQAAMYLRGEVSREEALDLACRETHHFAKRQMTWFKADKNVHWLRMPISENIADSMVNAVKVFYEGLLPDLSALPIVRLDSSEGS